MVGTCSDCKHWVLKPDSEYLEIKEFHKCNRIKQWWDATEWTEEFYRKLKDECKNDTAFVNDGSSYHAELITSGSFFCAHWEKIE